MAPGLYTLHKLRLARSATATIRHFTLGGGAPTTNRIFTSVRNASDFDTYMLLSSSSRAPLITLWTASWCTPCHTITPMIKKMIEEEKVGERNGNPISFAEIELDAPDIGEVAGRYMVTSIPMLLAFSRREAQMDTRITDVNQMKDKKFLEQWLETEAARRGDGGAGGSLFGFGGLSKWFGGGGGTS